MLLENAVSEIPIPAQKNRKVHLFYTEDSQNDREGHNAIRYHSVSLINQSINQTCSEAKSCDMSCKCCCIISVIAVKCLDSCVHQFAT